MTFWKDRKVAPMGYDIEVIKYRAVRHKMLVETRRVAMSRPVRDVMPLWLAISTPILSLKGFVLKPFLKILKRWLYDIKD